jgi:Domain of unknown function (DUF4440)
MKPKMKKSKLLLILLSLLFSCNIFAQNDKDFEKVKGILQTQAKSWNEGNIDGFMEYYWKSDNLQFIGSNGITYGWQNTLDRYKNSYPDNAAMGKLSFDIIKVDKRSKKVITLVGKFHLKREVGDLEGIFLLVWKKINGKWKIVVDQTC